jgi:ribose 5-phosphate isomerase B
MRIAYGTDDTTPATESLRLDLEARGHEVIVVADGVDWPDAGRVVGEAVATGRADLGVVWCWTGTGVVMAATKVPGVRAALCVDAETARGARRWNDANVVGLSLRLTTAAVAGEIVEAFLATGVDDGEARLVDRVEGPGRHAG